MKTKLILLLTIILASLFLIIYFGCQKQQLSNIESSSTIEKIEDSIQDSIQESENTHIQQSQNDSENNGENVESKENIEESKLNDKIFINGLSLNQDDMYILQKISIAEAGNLSVESMGLVMLVVLNRVQSEEFPNDVYSVVHQKNQFTPVSSGSYDKVQPNEKSQAAIDLVLSGWNESQGALYFESCKGESWHSKNLKLLFEKEGMRYYVE